jgi:hypothetical protein
MMGQIQAPVGCRDFRDATVTSFAQNAHKAAKAMIHPAAFRRFGIGKSPCRLILPVADVPQIL